MPPPGPSLKQFPPHPWLFNSTKKWVSVPKAEVCRQDADGYETKTSVSQISLLVEQIGGELTKIETRIICWLISKKIDLWKLDCVPPLFKIFYRCWCEPLIECECGQITVKIVQQRLQGLSNQTISVTPEQVTVTLKELRFEGLKDDDVILLLDRSFGKEVNGAKA